MADCTQISIFMQIFLYGLGIIFYFYCKFLTCSQYSIKSELGFFIIMCAIFSTYIHICLCIWLDYRERQRQQYIEI